MQRPNKNVVRILFPVRPQARYTDQRSNYALQGGRALACTSTVAAVACALPL